MHCLNWNICWFEQNNFSSLWKYVLCFEIWGSHGYNPKNLQSPFTYLTGGWIYKFRMEVLLILMGSPLYLGSKSVHNINNHWPEHMASLPSQKAWSGDFSIHFLKLSYLWNTEHYLTFVNFATLINFKSINSVAVILCSFEVFLRCLLQNVESSLVAVTVLCSESNCRVVMFRMGNWHDSLVVLAASTKQSQAGKPKRNEQAVGKVSDKESFPCSERQTFSQTNWRRYLTEMQCKSVNI